MIGAAVNYGECACDPSECTWDFFVVIQIMSSIQLQYSACVLYRRKFSRHEKFTKSLKTGFSRLFVREIASDIREYLFGKTVWYPGHNR